MIIEAGFGGVLTGGFEGVSLRAINQKKCWTLKIKYSFQTNHKLVLYVA
jgi:hypothetical protein